MASLPIKRYTPEEYLAIERAAEFKSEYFGGEMIAMAGASWKHGAIRGNVDALFRSALRGKPCRTQAGELRVQAGSAYLYPDLVIVCGKPQFADGTYLDTLLNPNVVIEVLSKSTEAEDRGIRFMRFGMIPSVTDYILISQDTEKIEHFYRDSTGVWERGRIITEPGDALTIETLGCALPLSEVYENIDPIQ